MERAFWKYRRVIAIYAFGIGLPRSRMPDPLKQAAKRISSAAPPPVWALLLLGEACRFRKPHPFDSQSPKNQSVIVA